VGTLKDPDDVRLVHRRGKRRNCIIPMSRRENVILKFVSKVETQLFETVACSQLHIHMIWSSLHICYVSELNALV